ncbi:hypothetical protein ACLOJK_002853 [Asimina triloba]
MDENDVHQAELWAQTISQYNPDVEYRSSDREYDILHHVFRWNNTFYEDVFQDGFRAWAQRKTANNIYYNLEHHVHHGGAPPLQSRRDTHVFVSTTLNNGWYPPPNRWSGTIYRYEIYAPGGIWVAQTLARYSYPRRDEVAFVAGIAPRYIRSAQGFRLNRQRRWERINTEIIINDNFNPQLRDIQGPVVDYWDENLRRREPLTVTFYAPPDDHALRKKQHVSNSTDSNTTHWYASNAANMGTYINAAFRSSRKNEVYLFMKNEYVLLDYAPGTTNDRVVNGPLLICDGYPSLVGTAFAEYGIDCAFGCYDENEAFIFSGDLCARINYAPHSKNDWIIEGPITIAKMFSFFEGTVFESGIDSAFESSRRYEAYLFRDDLYALINYSSNGSHLIAVRSISEGYPSLRGTIFERGIDAAFASHMEDEAYLFKGDSYARINFAPGTTNDYIIGGVKPIIPNWPSLRGILPHKNRGLDVHARTTVADAGHYDDDHHHFRTREKKMWCKCL